MYSINDQDVVEVARHAAAAASRGAGVSAIVAVVEQLRNGETVATINTRLAELTKGAT